MSSTFCTRDGTPRRHDRRYLPATVVLLFLALAPAAGSRAGPHEHDPVADPAAVVLAGRARFTVLTPELIRMEWSPQARFEDRASFVVLNRRLPVPEFSIERREGRLIIATDQLTLTYDQGAPDAGPRFSKDNLQVTLNLERGPVVWTPGTEDRGNLQGTYRTLDGISGDVALPPGLLSRDGWVLVDDSRRLLLDAVEGTDWPWVTPRRQDGALDWYFFGYGHHYRRALRDFTCVAGKIPLPPRFAFGTWWSRYWAYSDRELRELVNGFRDHGVPLDVLVVDMDWHLDGWTGYTWNPEYFPKPEEFLAWAHDQGLKVTLNLHPASGVGRHERAFEAVARHMDLDPGGTERVPFDCTDPRYVTAYFRYLHHPLQRQGIDFWWIDWQQGTGLKHGKLPEVDPLPWLNHLHWTDLQRDPQRRGRRPMLFSRWGGLGGHRYQVGFSGDTYNDWESLAFQPHFTATAGNVCYPFWSHDIGGHMPGPVAPELYTRWVQWGALSPILRTHTTKNPRAERRLWMFPDEHYRAMKDAFELRYALIPYIYTSARQCYDHALPLCRPLYYEWPQLDEAYTHGDQYLFGDQLLVAPVIAPLESLTQWARVTVWIPPGEWIAWYTGHTFRGPMETSMLVPLEEIPILVRSGAVIPMQPLMNYVGEKAVDPLILHIWPGQSGGIRVYEDDGVSVGYQSGEYAWTPVSHRQDGDARRITIGPVEGSFSGMPAERGYEVHLREEMPPGNVLVDGAPLAQQRGEGTVGWRYEPADQRLVLSLASRKAGTATQIRVSSPSSASARLEAERAQHLRGWLRLLGESAPSREDLAALLDRLDEDNLGGVVRALASDALTRRLLLARLLGLSVDAQATCHATDSSRIELSVHVSISPPLNHVSTATCRVVLAPISGWAAEDSPTQAVQLRAGELLTEQFSIMTQQAPQTAVAPIEVGVRVDGAGIGIPIEMVLLPSINHWWVIGPFAADYESSLETVFPPEREVDLEASYEGTGGGKLGWQPVTRQLSDGHDVTSEFIVDFQKVFGGDHGHAVAYALTYLQAPEATEATLRLGSDDGVAVWLNGTEIHRRDVPRPYTSKEDQVSVHLEQGNNTLLVKVSQQRGGWQFAAHLETAYGQPLPEITAQLQPQ